MKIYLASDHGGFALKEKVKSFLGESVIDLGAKQLDQSDDYPIFAFKLAAKVVATPGSLGFLFCRSGSGMVIAANKVKGARAVEIYNPQIAQHAVEHNQANIFAFGADFTTQEVVFESIIKILQSQPDLASRHQRRLAQIQAYETNH